MVKTDRVSSKIFLVLSFLSLFLFLYISALVLNGRFAYLDSAISEVIYSFRNPMMTGIMHFVTFLGGEFTLLSSVIIVVFLVFKKHKKEAGLFAFIIFSGFALNNFLKYILKVPRPDIDPLSAEAFYSLPSGHAMISLIFYGFLSYFVFHFTRNKRLSVLVLILSIIIILLIGFSRVYLGVHYSSDVLAGFVAGFWWLTTAILIDKTLTSYKLFKGKENKRL